MKTYGNKALDSRVRSLLISSFAADALLVIAAAAGVLSGTAFMVVFIVLKAATALFWYFRYFRSAKTLSGYECDFAAQTALRIPYEPECVWSDSNAGVVSRYEKAANWKDIMELSVESSKYIALQRQINPHFLYNTLDSIRSDLIIEGQPQIAETVEALSKYFAYAISNIEKMATISEELDNVRDYFLVQKSRFEDRLSLEIVNEADEGLLQEIKIPRLTIQPVIENAIIHGIEASMEDGLITVHIEPSGDSVYIHVIDNGVGMDEETLYKLNERLRTAEPGGQEKRRGGIALVNVNSRIKLLCGEEYGLHVSSVPNTGTSVHIRIPVHIGEPE